MRWWRSFALVTRLFSRGSGERRCQKPISIDYGWATGVSKLQPSNRGCESEAVHTLAGGWMELMSLPHSLRTRRDHRCDLCHQPPCRQLPPMPGDYPAPVNRNKVTVARWSCCGRHTPSEKRATRPSPISATRHCRTGARALKLDNCRLVLANNKWHLPRLVGRELTGNKAAPTLPKKRAQVTGSWC